MKKSSLLLLFLLIVTISACNQTNSVNDDKSANDDKDVAAAVENLIKGFTDADKDILDKMTASGLIYGHSSGKVQNKTEFIDEVVSKQPLEYVKIDLENQTINVIGNTAVVRHILAAETLANGTPGNLRIGNVLIWQKQQGEWKLIARQAYRL
jgi:hypothetical protein